jgi:phospholipid/cholesterol/gamma-HCH transport system permease protein
MESIANKSFRLIGETIISLFSYIGGLLLLFWESLLWISRGAIMQIRLILDQAASLGVNSSTIVLITTAFTGAVISLQLAYMAARFGADRFVGFGVAVAMARELAPMITAIAVAGRAGSSITAELGSMQVTEQIDALEAMAVSPVRYLVVPRLIAMAIIIPMLCLFAIIAGVVGGGVVANITAGIGYNVYFESIADMVMIRDVYKGLFKSFIFAIQIAIIACYQGLKTRGGAAGVGTATTGSVVYSMLIVFITNFLLSAILFPPEGGGIW